MIFAYQFSICGKYFYFSYFISEISIWLQKFILLPKISVYGRHFNSLTLNLFFKGKLFLRNFCFWTNFRFLGDILIFSNKSFLTKIPFLAKILIFDQKLVFSEISILTEILTFDHKSFVTNYFVTIVCDKTVRTF